MHAALAGELVAQFFSMICVREHLRLSSCSMQSGAVKGSCHAAAGQPVDQTSA